MQRLLVSPLYCYQIFRSIFHESISLQFCMFLIIWNYLYHKTEDVLYSYLLLIKKRISLASSAASIYIYLSFDHEPYLLAGN